MPCLILSQPVSPFCLLLFDLVVMRLRYRHDGVEWIVELSEGLDGYTVSDLVAALGGVVDGEVGALGGVANSEVGALGGVVDGEVGALGGVANSEVGIAGVSVDGRLHDLHTPLSSVLLWNGSLLELTTTSESMAEFVSDSCSARPLDSGNPAESTCSPHGDALRPVLAVTGGLQAGDEIVQPQRHVWTIGRSADCDVVLNDPTVSRHHVRVVDHRGKLPVIADLGSLNGTAVSGRAVQGPSRVPLDTSVRLGATRMEWRSTVGDAPAAMHTGTGAKAGRVSFNRPPRRRPPTDPHGHLRAPARPPPKPRTEPLSWIGIVLPMAAGLVMALVWSPFMAVFAALGPLLAIGTWLERRRRASKDHIRSCRIASEQVERFVASLPKAHMAERRRRVSLVPDPAEIVRRARAPSVRCWERRPDDADAMQLGIGTADVPWVPSLDVAVTSPDKGTAVADDAQEEIAALGPLEDVPITVSLAPGEVVGVVGPAAEARSVARSLVLQAAVLHGPADLSIVGLVPGRDVHHSYSDAANPWRWMLWLPHTVDPSGRGSLVAAESTDMTEVVDAVRGDGTSRLQLLVIDGAEPLIGRSAPGRELLALDRTAGIVVVSDIHVLPSACTAIVEVVNRFGGLRLMDPSTHGAIEPLFAWGVTEVTAADAAAGLARLDDPELVAGDSDCPPSVALVDLIGGEITPEAVLRRWSDTGGASRMATPIGVDGNGPVEVDLVGDGPHLLVGGTTGSGKSELLRTLVAGLAMSADPEHVAFVLIDYKGGAAFDRCADMPHVAGMVTDLDDHLAERALVCLEAELQYREKRLREAEAEDLAEFQARSGVGAVSNSGDPLPRLVVVVDEFATLAAELPEFLHSLVGIAQRGRSLGVHMVLATQRPAGVVTDDIRANTSCRICLRVTDRSDSNDVIGAPDAADIPRHRPGRAFARFGPGDLKAFQTALVTGATPPASAGLRVAVVGDRLCSGGGELSPCGDSEGGTGTEREQDRCDGLSAESGGRGGKTFGSDQSGGSGHGVHGSRQRSVSSDLDKVVNAVRSAHARRGGLPPRSPWPAPLPSEVTDEAASEMAGPGSGAAWLVDDPTRQRQFAGAWRPDDGHLVVIGGPGSGTSTTLASVVLDLCRNRSPGEQHIYAIDFDGGLLTALDGLPHTGSVVHRGDAERRMRLLRFLDEEISGRRASDAGAVPADADAAHTHNDAAHPGSSTAAAHPGSSTAHDRPDIVLVVDDLAGLSRAHDPVRDLEPHQWFARIWSNGPSVGVRAAVSIRRSADLSPELAASAGVVLVHATTDIGDGLRFGLRADTARLEPGRALRADDGRELQVVRPAGGDFVAAVADVAAACSGSLGSSAGLEGIRCVRGPGLDSGVPAAVGFPPVVIGVLPAVVPADRLPVSAVSDERSIDIRFAMSDLTLDPVGFALHEGEHAMVLGPARSGRSTALAAIGAAAHGAGVEVLVVTDASNSDLAVMLGVEPVAVTALGDEISRGGSCRRLLLADDADRLKDATTGILAQIADDRRGRDHLVVAVTADRLRSAYGHWLTELRSCRTGVLFRPGPLDGDLLGVALPPRLRLMQRPGYGLIVANGVAVSGQVAQVTR